MAPQPTGLSDWDTPSARTTMQQRVAHEPRR